MQTVEKIQEELKQTLSEKRYLHCIGVAKMAEKLAKQYNIDEQTAYLTGLIHDMAKEISVEDSKNYLKEHNIAIDEIEEKNPALLHAKVGAELAKNKYNINEQMQKAIQYHTTGNAQMDKLAKIIYVADKIEETRNFEGIEPLRKLAFQDLNKAMLAILNYDIKKNIENGKLIHPDSILTRNNIIEKL